MNNMSSRAKDRSRSGFTLIELLVVIAIIAILAVVVVLTLNPAELLRQSRDANRLSDLSTANNALNLYNTDQNAAPGYLLGSVSSSYLSLIDPAATTTGTNCATMGLSAVPPGWSDRCSASSTVRNVDSTGWIPVNFNSLSTGAPLATLPVDPINATSSLFYYTYATNGSQYEITVPLESQKYIKQGLLLSNSDPTRNAAGSAPVLVPQAEGLVGYWNLDEGTNATAFDKSGNGINGAWAGSASGTSGYYSVGKVGPWAGFFNGANDYVNLGTSTAFNLTSGLSLVGWFNTTSSANQIIIGKCFSTSYYVNDSATGVHFFVDNVPILQSGTYYNNGWHFFAATSQSGANKLYVDGGAAVAGTATPTVDAYPLEIGNSGCSNGYFNGLIDDVRVYDRALSAAEIQAIYNAEK